MIRKLLASTAMLALMTAGSFSIAQAQDEPAQTQEPAAIQQDATQGAAGSAEVAAEAEEKLTPEQPTIASAFMGQSVFSSADPESDNIGEVNDLIISEGGDITHAVIGVGGFLGIGEKNVAVPFEELQVVERDGEIRLVYASTKEQLEAAEEFDRTAYDPSARFAEEQAAMAPDPAAPAGGMAPATGTDPLAPAPAPDVAATEEPAADATAEQDTAVMEEPAADATAEQDMAATEQQEAHATAEQDMAATEEPAANATAEQNMAAGEAGFLDYDVNAIRASRMLGQQVYGAEDEAIGEVSDLVLQEDGGARVAIIDVGGFLGMGEKPVAIPFDQIEVQTEEGAEPRLTVAMTREELESAPAFEGTAAEQDMAATEAPAEGTEAPVDATAPDATADATAETAEGEDMVAGTEAGTAGFELATQNLSAEELIGSAVHGANDENIGEVGDVVFTSSGDIEAVIVDVGGFLGIGEKPVAVQFDALNVQKDTSGEVQLMINASQEQLEGAPAYQDEAAAVQ